MGTTEDSVTVDQHTPVLTDLMIDDHCGAPLTTLIVWHEKGGLGNPLLH